MLSVERKKTDKIDFVKPLEQFIRNQYSAQIAQDHQEAINFLQQLREDVRNSTDKNDVVKDLMARYYGLVLSLETRFPISENHIRISFVWYDSFKGRKSSDFSIFFEKANVLFNMGALLSQLAVLQNRSSADGIKVACQQFQQAAGVFEDLKEAVERHPQTAADLTTDVINTLINLMLAQAQECFFEKAVKDNMNPSIIAKLAGGVAEYYEVTQQLMSQSAVSNLLPKPWSQHIQVKALVYQSLAQYRMAMVHGKADEYGLQVSRLIAAHDILEDVKKNKLKGLPTDVTAWFNVVYAQVSQSRQTSEKENDTIYHDTVVPASRLSSIERKAMVKAIRITDAMRLSPDQDPFFKLVPFVITEKLSIYQEKKDILIRNELRAIDEHNQLVIGSLSSMNLPGAIEAIEKTAAGGQQANPLPQGIQEKMHTVRNDGSNGGAQMIVELIDTVNKLSEEDQAILDRAIRALDDEEREDNEMRNVHSSKWQRTPSHTLTGALRQEAAKYKGNIEHARKSDQYVLRKFQDHQDFVFKLSGPVETVVSMLPSAAVVAPAANSREHAAQQSSISALKQSLGLLDKLIADRGTLRAELVNLSQKDDISVRLLNAQQNNASANSDEEIYSSELSKYSALQQQLASSFQQQEELLGRIQQENSNFVAIRQQLEGGANSAASAISAQREHVLQSLNNAFKVYTELKAHLREGIQFYTNFQEILNQFGSKCNDFVLARQTEKQDLIRDIQSQQSAAVPPSFPPPSSGTGMPGGWQPTMKPVYQQAGNPPYPAAPSGGVPTYTAPPYTTGQPYPAPPPGVPTGYAMPPTAQPFFSPYAPQPYPMQPPYASGQQPPQQPMPPYYAQPYPPNYQQPQYKK